MKGESVYVWKVMRGICAHSIWLVKFKANTHDHQPIPFLTFFAWVDLLIIHLVIFPPKICSSKLSTNPSSTCDCSYKFIPF